jgi:ATP-dependent RNA helicase RhlE
MPFKALGLGPQIVKAIADARYAEPTPIQSRAVPPILEGKDVIGIAQTGTGKTAAFVWPLIERLSQTVPKIAGKDMARVLVLTPTRELSAQVEENLRNYAKYLPLKSAIIFGGVSEGPQISTLRRGVDLVVATPGRLLDHLNQGNVSFSHLECLVLDEADRMLDMGFLPDIKRIIRALPAQRQTLLFSATFSKEIEEVSKAFLNHPVTVEVSRRASAAESVAQFVYEVPKAIKISLLLHLLKDETMNCVLVFSRTKHGADKIARRLADVGIKTATLHSNRSQNQRLQALDGFKKGFYRVLVATDIAARGIDVDGISHVVNFDMPPDPEDYIHRIGRTGRMAAIGDAISFVAPDDRDTLRQLERFINRGIPRKTAEGFDYKAPATDVSYDHDRERGRRPDRGPRPERRPQGGRPERRPEGGRPPFRSDDRRPRFDRPAPDRDFPRAERPSGDRDSQRNERPAGHGPSRDDRGPAMPGGRPDNRGPGGRPFERRPRPAGPGGRPAFNRDRERAPARDESHRPPSWRDGDRERSSSTHTPPSRRDADDRRPAGGTGRPPYPRRRPK